MNVLRILTPCALQSSETRETNSDNKRSCWFMSGWGEDASHMIHRMGASASSSVASVGGDSVQAARLSPSGNYDQHGFAIRERKKKMTGFATLRKKFIRKRRSSKVCDHGRIFRDMISTWSHLEAIALLEEYEALAALKDLHVQAELARPPAATFKQDLSLLYDYKQCSDADLVYQGACFPVHRAILSARCPYFRDLLAGYPGYGARICLDLRTPNLEVQTFSALLRYLYTGDICPHDATFGTNILQRLGEEFGTLNPLEQDLRYLLDTGDYADAALVFTSDSDCQRPDSGCSEYGFRPKLELPCHKAILSARSPFFRNLIQRRTKSGEDRTERTLHIPTRIILDESVIPKRYARVLLHAVYLDTVDLSLILRGNGCGSSAGSLGEVQALTHTGRMRPSPLEEAMELYQIGRFLELDILSQGCEDIILDCLTLESLPTVLKWGSQPHGSAWVHRQALHYLREEFQPIASSTILHQLDHAHLMNVLQSHFLQASELEILQAVLKWGEHELVRRMEDREPNLLNHTVHSVTRKGVKKKDLSDIELRDILSELLPLVRIDHILPHNSEILTQAIRRGLVSTPPSHMIGDGRDSIHTNAWIRGGKKNGFFVRPRLFMPYYEEIKSLVEEQIVQDTDLIRLQRTRYVADIPDALYMVDEKPRTIGTAGVDVLAAAFSVPDSSTMAAMLKREQKLRQSPSCLRAIDLPLSSRSEINRQVRLRVVREFNLPDAVADILENTASFMKQQDSSNMTGIEDINTPDMDINARTSAASYYGRNMTFPRPAASSYADRHELPAVVIEGENNRLLVEQQDNSSCSDGHLSGVMPDVAMATASFGALQLMEHQELDLGDGTSHILQHISPSAGNLGGLSRSSLPRQHQGHITAPPPLPYAYQRTVTALPRFI